MQAGYKLYRLVKRIAVTTSVSRESYHTPQLKNKFCEVVLCWKKKRVSEAGGAHIARLTDVKSAGRLLKKWTGAAFLFLVEEKRQRGHDPRNVTKSRKRI